MTLNVADAEVSASGDVYQVKSVGDFTAPISAGDQYDIGSDVYPVDIGGNFSNDFTYATGIYATGNIGIVTIAGDSDAVYRANDDNAGQPGIIDFINVGGDFNAQCWDAEIGHTSAIDTGQNGDVHFLSVGGTAYDIGASNVMHAITPVPLTETSSASDRQVRDDGGGLITIISRASSRRRRRRRVTC